MADSTAQRRLKGILALLPIDVMLYAYNKAEWNAKQGSALVVTHRQRRRKKRESALLQDIEGARIGTTAQTITLYEHIHARDVTVIFLMDPYQPYSVQLFQKLVTVCQLKGDDALVGEAKIHCLVVTQCVATAVIDSLLQHSGMLLLPCDENFVVWKLAAGFSACPSIAVVESATGRRVCGVHEDLAVDWNTAAHVREAWLVDRTTALTVPQQVKACTLFPASCGVQ
jgi:hypothetical protein